MNPRRDFFLMRMGDKEWGTVNALLPPRDLRGTNITNIKGGESLFRYYVVNAEKEKDGTFVPGTDRFRLLGMSTRYRFRKEKFGANKTSHIWFLAGGYCYVGMARWPELPVVRLTTEPKSTEFDSINVWPNHATGFAVPRIRWVMACFHNKSHLVSAARKRLIPIFNEANRERYLFKF